MISAYTVLIFRFEAEDTTRRAETIESNLEEVDILSPFGHPYLLPLELT